MTLVVSFIKARFRDHRIKLLDQAVAAEDNPKTAEYYLLLLRKNTSDPVAMQARDRAVARIAERDLSEAVQLAAMEANWFNFMQVPGVQGRLNSWQALLEQMAAQDRVEEAVEQARYLALKTAGLQAFGKKTFNKFFDDFSADSYAATVWQNLLGRYAVVNWQDARNKAAREIREESVLRNNAAELMDKTLPTLQTRPKTKPDGLAP